MARSAQTPNLWLTSGRLSALFEKFAERLCSLDRPRESSMDSRQIDDLLQVILTDAEIERIPGVDLHERAVAQGRKG